MTTAETPHTDPRSTIRRQDRVVNDDAWIAAFLMRAPVGVLATQHGDQPFVTPNLFVYDPQTHAIILHTARKGRMRTNVEANARAAFTVLEMGRLLPADTALEFSVEYASVVAFGPVQIMTGDETAARDLQLLLDKYAPHLAPGVDYRPPIEPEIARTSVFRLMIEAWSGKRKEVAADFPGAYWYAYEPVLASLTDSPSRQNR